MNQTLALLSAALLGALPAAAQSLRPGETLSSIAIRPISAPNPVPGADGRVHLAYELLVVNPSKLFMTLDKVEAVDAGGFVLWSAEGAALGKLTTLWSGSGERIDPGGSAAVFLDVTFPPEDAIPDEIFSRVTATREISGADGKPAPLPASAPVPATITFTGAATPEGPAAVVIDPPLRGSGWVAANGCCDAITSHRGAIMAVNGAPRVPERFAIDWVRLGEDGRIFSGDGSKVEDFAYYGTEVRSVAAGTVVNLYDAADTQVPNADPTGITTENIGGDMIVVDIGGGNYAFYAHLQRGSLRVKLGDRVTAGQVVALLGNSGNTTAPHLHFHVMDGPSPLDANGLPYVFRAFSSPGVLTNEGDVEGGKPAVIGPRLAGAHENALPLNDQVVDFD